MTETAAGEHDWIERENPARPREIVGRVPVTAPERIDDVVHAAHRWFRDWSEVPLALRLRRLSEAAVRLDAGRAELAALLARESGKPIADCRGEIAFAATYLRWVCEHAPAVCAARELADEQGRLVLAPKPYGVVAAVTPWNAPIILSMIKLGPALAAGNTVVLKPSPLAPLAVTRAAQSLPGVAVVHGGPDLVRALVAHPLVRKVAFTGGEQAGGSIAATAGRAIKPVTLELGGNDPAVFLDDFALAPADYERLVLASFATAGQVCMAAKRLYVPQGRAAEFTEAYLAAARRVLLVGDPSDEAVTMGPVVTRAAAERMTALVDDARRRGGRIVELANSPGGEGYFVDPVLATHLPDDAELVCREQFGPVVPLLTYRDEAEVLARANASELGLGASVWSADEDRAVAFAARLEAGFTFVNTHNRTGMSLRAPFGGIKRSGFGREYAEEGLREYLQTTVVHAPAAFRPGGSGMPVRAYPGQ
ncbi:aldehyde dehydrogenase family protein [Nocardia sp. CDC159]|uniref:Aldehyde dehydrogenase family protein n=1 Tax=Nocardia pulmonis TaxID=2951408 RepID=A0A9X2E5E1_9NOCA|nr:MULTISPECIES: aldehyde dehydrogenase family protein [Nocardia]MCM6771931.1 aldehyde dehydrogenase family protein [Nocardia pulmonis]MCM6785411.1 aldehyde dehydrogenase family protein [Nocardia sp. CDC159]